jgi:glycosyltransferase involved in cell wall biosynthesis
MKILLTIHHEFDRNAGAPGVIWKLGQEFEKLGHNVSYYSFNDLPPQIPKRVQGIVFPEFVANHILKLTRHQTLDIIDASTGDAWFWSKLQRNSRNRPLLVTRSHGLEHVMHLGNLAEADRGNLHLSWKYPLYHGGFRLWEVAESLRACDLALLLNQFDVNYTVSELGVDRARTHVVANGIPEEFLNLPFETTPTEQDTVLQIAQVGSYIHRKGIHYGVPALNQILHRYPQVRMSFLGTGCSEAQVLADFEPAVCDRVKVIPHYKHEMLPALLQGHHIKLFPTLSEGFSLALPEAMACGLVPVTTATPGPMEIVQDTNNGLLVPAQDAEAITQALERLIRDRPYLEQLRRKAYETAQDYSWQKIAATTLALYEQAKHFKEANSAK